MFNNIVVYHNIDPHIAIDFVFVLDMVILYFIL